MATQTTAQLKAWFRKGMYPTEAQFADLVDSFRHRNEKVGLPDVDGLAEALNTKYDRSEASELEARMDRNDAAVERMEDVQENQSLEISAIHRTDEAQQAELDALAGELAKVRALIKEGATLDEAKTAMLALGASYAGLHALASTVKTFLEASDTKDKTINTWRELEQFLDGITDTDSLAALLSSMERRVTEACGRAVAEVRAAFEERADGQDAAIGQLRDGLRELDGEIRDIREENELQQMHIDEIYGLVESGTVTEVEYGTLVSLRDRGSLRPGSLYRITDYETAVANDPEARSAGHLFDIVVRALAPDTLCEEAAAVRSARDTAGYFAAARPEAWKVKYCLDNDTARFQWADPTNGRGVIYRLVDEWGNDSPYDFKNVQFRRYRVRDDSADGLLPDLANTYSGLNAEMEGLTADTADYVWAYTFSLGDRKRAGSDASLSTAGHCANNVIRPATAGRAFRLNNVVLYDETGTEATRTDGNIICGECVGITMSGHGNVLMHGCHGIVTGAGSHGNTIGPGCHSLSAGKEFAINTIGAENASSLFGPGCRANTLGAMCSGNKFGTGSQAVTFGEFCEDNVLERGCSVIRFGSACSDNQLGTSCQYIVLQDNCFNNIFEGYIDHVAFGLMCYNNMLSEYCLQISFGSSCSGNEVGTFSGGISFGFGCINNIIGQETGNIYIGNQCSGNWVRYCEYMKLNDRVCNIDMYNWTDSSNPVKNVEVLGGTSGKSNSKLLQIRFATGMEARQYAGLNSAGELRIWTPADLVN